MAIRAIKKSRFTSGGCLWPVNAAPLLTPDRRVLLCRPKRKSCSSCLFDFCKQKHRPGSYSESVMLNWWLNCWRQQDHFYSIPCSLKIHRFVRDSDRAWRAFGKVFTWRTLVCRFKIGFWAVENYMGLAWKISKRIRITRRNGFWWKGFIKWKT